MVTRRWRRGFAGGLSALAVAVMAVSCGDGRPDSGGPAPHRDGSPPGTATTRPGRSGAESVADRVAYFSSSARTAAGAREVLHDRAEVRRFAGKVAADDPEAANAIVSGARGTDFSRRVLVGWTATTGCSAATAATLTVSGNRLQVRVSQPKPPPECVAAFRATAVFEVPRERIPARPDFS
jgi:hypothetical protein